MPKLTSDNCPIRIDFLPAAVVRLPGRIGMTIAPGKKISGIHGDWHRDLGKDLRRMKVDLGASVLVSLIEAHELELLNIPALAETAQRLGFELLELPIPDVGVPDDVERLRQFVERIVHAASAGRTVAIHCRGGLGRSGLVAACCLVALGIEAEKAISIVRATRKGAIETPAQEQSVRDFGERVRDGERWSFAAVREREPGPRHAPAFSRVLGCLLGGAVGDALGYPIEFFPSHEAILDRFGDSPPERTDPFSQGDAEVSDDTQMTLFVAEGMIRATRRSDDRGLCSVPAVLRRALLRWYDTQTTAFEQVASLQHTPWRSGWLRTEPRLYARRAPGSTCMSSLHMLSTAREGTVLLNDSKGCGAIMRSAPVGLASVSRESAFEAACESGCHTHGHPLGYLPAGYLASVIFDVVRGLPVEDAMTLADELLRREAATGTSPAGGAPLQQAHRGGATELLDWTRRAREAAARGAFTPADVEGIGAGWTGEEALAISLLCALSAQDGSPDTVARALWAAVAHGGDSDSTGAITGNILGARFGVEALPEAWARRVELRDTIERLAGDLCAVRSSELDYDAYPPD